MTKTRIYNVRARLKKEFSNDVIFASVDPTKDDDFIAILNIPKGNHIPVAKVYEKGNRWYIWWLRENYRQEIKNFTESISYFQKWAGRNREAICVE